MVFNTAVFWDIGGLLKGYRVSSQTLQSLSPASTLDTLKQTGCLGGIAIQRAYADWSDSRLEPLLEQIADLGIDPVQVMGFARKARKNGAELQLAIDAIDLAHVRPGLQVFVLVSGDGSFAPLARKLHEYGKVVVGCMYRNAASRVLRAVCDEFVWLVEPAEKEIEEDPVTVAQMAMAQP